MERLGKKPFFVDYHLPLSRIHNIQVLRAFAALAVVFFHLVKVETKYGGGEGVLSPLFEFGMSGVDLFFVISGYIMASTTMNRATGWRPSLDFLMRRFTRIYPPYAFFSLLVLVVYSYQPTWVNSSQGNRVDLWASFLLLPSATLPLLMVGWTLVHEMYFYFMLALLGIVLTRRTMPWGVALWAVVVIVGSSIVNPTSPWTSVWLHPLTIEFIMGYLLAKIVRKTLFLEMGIKMATGLLVVLSVGVFQTYRMHTGNFEPTGWFRVLMFGVPSAALVYVAAGSTALRGRLAMWLGKVGDASYSLYLTHLLSLSALGRLWKSVASPKAWDNWIGVPVLLVFSVAVSLWAYRWIEKPLLRLALGFASPPEKRLD